PRAVRAASARSTAAASQRSALATGATSRVRAVPPTTAADAYSPSAVATPMAADAPTRRDVRAVRLTRSAAMAPTGTAIPYPASSPATRPPITALTRRDPTPEPPAVAALRSRVRKEAYARLGSGSRSPILRHPDSGGERIIGVKPGGRQPRGPSHVDD